MLVRMRHDRGDLILIRGQRCHPVVAAAENDVVGTLVNGGLNSAQER